MYVLAAAGSSANGPGVWTYLAILAATAAGYMGVPFVGTAAIGAAAVFASQGKLNIAAVLIVAVIGNEVGGLLGYKIGDRWGRRILEHPGPALEWRKKTLAKGETIYQKWGRLAVFFTPALVSGALRMKFGQFARRPAPFGPSDYPIHVPAGRKGSPFCQGERSTDIA